jgi:hypothetical protein
MGDRPGRRLRLQPRSVVQRHPGRPADVICGRAHRGSINQTYLEPYVSYSLDSGWSGQIDPPIIYNWTAEKRDAWTLPIGADVGNVVQLAGEQLGLQAGAYDFVKHPQCGPGWMVRVQATLLFPTIRSR